MDNLIALLLVTLSIYNTEAASVDLRLRGQLLFTSMINQPDIEYFYGEKKPIPDKLKYGFTIRRARMDLRGHYITQSLKYRMQAEFAGKNVSLLDLYADFKAINILTIRAGQWKVPFNREELTSSGELELVDRSIVNSFLGLFRDIGVDLMIGGENLVFHLAGFTGSGRNFTRINFVNTNLLYVAKVEYAPIGKIIYGQPNLKRERALNGSLSGVFFPIAGEESLKIQERTDQSFMFKYFITYSDKDKQQKSVYPGTLIAGAGDIKLWWDVFGLELEGILTRYNITKGERRGENISAYGIRVQPSVLIDKSGLAIRFGLVKPSSSIDELKNKLGKPAYELTAGLSHYFKDHTKIQVDYSFQDIGDDAKDISGNKIKPNHIVRVQFQVYVK